MFQPKGINYSGATLELLLVEYARLVNRSIIRSPTANQALATPVFFVNQTPLTRTEAIQAYQTIYGMNGLAFIEAGDKFLKVVTAAEAIQAGQRPIVITDPEELPEMGQFVTYIAQLRYVKPSEVGPVLVPFQSGKFGGITAVEPQMLVLRDFTENIKRMLEMIEKVDIGMPAEYESEVIPIKFAKAEEIASALGALSGSGATTTVGQRTGGATPTGAGARPTTPGAMPGMTTPGTVGATTGTPSATGTFSDRINRIIQQASRTSGSGEFQIIGPNKIVADVRANSLIVFAARHDLEVIKDIIAKLDIVLPQVVIETIILDVGLDNAWNFGINAGQRPKFVDGTNSAFGGTINNANNPLGTGISFLNQITTNANFTYPGGPGLGYFGKLGGNLSWDFVLQAAASDSTVNVIQKPRIQTSHAKPARIFIGGTVPYVQSTYYGGGFGGGPSSSYQQLPVGIGLQVTPYINADGLVVLTIDDFSIDEISGSTDIAGVGQVPNTTKRQLLGEIAVRDGETIMLGGFVRNSETKSKSGVPVLKDIPLLGALFTSRGSSKERKELIVLMRPTVLQTPALAAAHVESEKQSMPGVIRAEMDMEKFERESREQTLKHREAADKERFKKRTPFTDEEKRLYGTP